MTRKIERWWQERTATIKGLRRDLQTLQTDYETLDRLHMETAASERRLAEELNYLQSQYALSEAHLRSKSREVVALEQEIASLRGRIARAQATDVNLSTRGDSAARIEKAQLAGDAA